MTPKLGKTELCFCTVLVLNEIYLPTKFHVDISCYFKDMSRTRIADERPAKRQLYAHPSGSILKNIQIYCHILLQNKWFTQDDRQS
jgi:hypothetical protein